MLIIHREEKYGFKVLIFCCRKYYSTSTASSTLQDETNTVYM